MLRSGCRRIRSSFQTVEEMNMNRKFALVAAAAAVCVVAAAPVFSSPLGTRVMAKVFGEETSGNPIVLASDHDNDGGRSWRIFRSGDDDEGEDEDDDGGALGNVANPAPAGTVAPPANGLFNNGGAKPQVQVN
jgi:hypothetical protein